MPKNATNGSHHRRLSALEADRAIYIDFEGLTGNAPSIAGVLVGDEFETVVLEPVLESAARAKGLRCADPVRYLRDLLSRASREGRRVCGFGRHELQVVHDHFGIDFGPVYGNVHRVAKRYWKQTHPDERPPRPVRSKKRWTPRGKWTLAFFERSIGIARPAHLRGHNAASRLRAVRDGLRKHSDYEKLGRSTKGKWTKLLQYNEQDVRSTRVLAQTASGE